MCDSLKLAITGYGDLGTQSKLCFDLSQKLKNQDFDFFKILPILLSLLFFLTTRVYACKWIVFVLY